MLAASLLLTDHVFNLLNVAIKTFNLGVRNVCTNCPYNGIISLTNKVRSVYMAAKQYREQFRSDSLTSELQSALQMKFEQNKSEIYRTAIYRMAKQELSEEEFQEILLGITDLERN